MILLPRQNSNHSIVRPLNPWLSHWSFHRPPCSIKHVLDGYCSSHTLFLATAVGCSAVNTAKAMSLLRLSLRRGSDPNHAKDKASVPSSPSKHSGVIQNSLMRHCSPLSMRFQVEGRGGDTCRQLPRLARERGSHLEKEHWGKTLQNLWLSFNQGCRNRRKQDTFKRDKRRWHVLQTDVADKDYAFRLHGSTCYNTVAPSTPLALDSYLLAIPYSL